MAAVGVATTGRKTDKVFKPAADSITGPEKAEFSHTRCIN
jgi:hypothetical protein